MALIYAFCFFRAMQIYAKQVWRVAMHEQKESLEKAVLRMCSEDGEENYGKRIIESVQSTHTRGA